MPERTKRQIKSYLSVLDVLIDSLKDIAEAKNGISDEDAERINKARYNLIEASHQLSF